MSDRSRRQDRGNSRADRSGTDAERFTGDGSGERGYRGRSPNDVPPGSVPGGSYGAGGGYHRGGFGASTGNADGTGASVDRDELERPRQPEPEQRAGESGEWRDGYGAYGFGPTEPAPGSSSRRDPRSRRAGTRSGYAEQGFGAGESRGENWGGGARGGYGGGQPGGTHGTRGGGWAASGERFEQGRGARSYGPDGWGGSAPRGRGPRPRGGHGHDHGEYGTREDWATSEFAGRGEFGSEPHGWGGATSAGTEPGSRRERWDVPGPYSGVGPEGYRRSEDAIRDDVCERLTRHGELDASSISVRVENGEVVLEGVVDSRRSKRMAESTADSVAGVRDVHNRLRIEQNSFDRDRMEGRSGDR